MIQMTMQVSDDLARRLKPIEPWLPTIIELSLIRFKTVAAATASEIVEFLSTNPSQSALLNFHVSNAAQERLQRLLALNEAGLLSPQEQDELDELEQIEHILVMLKTQNIPRES